MCLPVYGILIRGLCIASNRALEMELQHPGRRPAVDVRIFASLLAPYCPQAAAALSNKLSTVTVLIGPTENSGRRPIVRCCAGVPSSPGRGFEMAPD
jgi:hypothetical protein